MPGFSSMRSIVDPNARLRRLRPDPLVYSYEWFEDDHASSRSHRTLRAVARARMAGRSLTLHVRQKGWVKRGRAPLG